MHRFRIHHQSQKINNLTQGTTSPKITINKDHNQVIDKFTQ